MVKCPFCGFENEDGVLFCEQCKSDLSSVPSAPPPETVPMAAIVDEPVDLGSTAPFPMDLGLDSLPVAKLEPAADAPIYGLDGPPVAEGLAALFAPEAAALPVAEVVPAPAETPAVAPAPEPLAAGSQPRLKVMRGLKVGFEFAIYPEYNYIGRADEKPVDVDLEDQEPPDRVWCSRQHAVIFFDEAAGSITLEDLNSSNGTFVNRNRVYPGEKKALNPNDVIQIGTVHMKLLV